MASNMLFRTTKASPVYNYPGGDIKEYYFAGKFVRITSIHLYNKSDGSVKEIGENEVLNSELTSNQVKYLYVNPGGVYIDAKNTQYVQNFNGDMGAADVVNKKGNTINDNVNSFYGPNFNCPIKLSKIQKGTTLFIKRVITIDGSEWVYATFGSNEGWIAKHNVYYDESSSTYTNSANISQSINDNNYSNITVDYGHMQKPVTYPGRTIKGSGSENMLYDSEIRALIQSAGIYNRDEIEWYDKFSRFGYLDPFSVLTNTREYVFITKPDLHIFASPSSSSSGLNPELARMAIFQDAYYRYRPILKQLQWSVDRKNPFMNLLSNSIKSSLDLPGISADEIDTSSNIYGTKMSYRRASETSDESFDFSIEFEDTKYLEVYMLFKLFDEYEKRKLWGDITPPDPLYTIRKILHDQVSIYKFIVADDGMSLIYWAKLTGCYPKSVPREAFSDIGDPSSGNALRFSVQWHAQFVEDMDPQILSDFNTLIMPKYNVTRELPLYNEKINAIDGTWAATPYIKQRRVSNENNIEFRYLLGWRV